MIKIGIDPVIHLGPINIGWYGIMVALAVLTMILWALYQVKRGARISYDTVITAALVGIPSGIVFSKLLHILDRWQYYSQHPGEMFSGAGLTIWGAVLGVALGIWIYSRFRKIPYGYFVDMLAPGIILAQAIGRVGCTILGDDYGYPTSLPWGVVYTNPNSFAYPNVGPTPTHPVVVYEIIFNLIVFGILLKLRGKLKPDGSLFLVYLVFYSVWRFGSDFLREGTPFLFGLHQAQIISIIVLLICIPNLAIKTRWVKAQAEVKTDAGG